jgi:cytochrome b
LWDIVVRISHWGLTVVVLGNAVFTKGGTIMHQWFGWVGLTLLVIRLTWGLIGRADARFGAFPPSPRRAIEHLDEVFAGAPRSYRSHNPAGAAMIYAIWLTLAALIGTGLVMTKADFPWNATQHVTVLVKDSEGWFAFDHEEGVEGSEHNETRSGIGTVHLLLANLLLLLVGIHVGGVSVESLLLRRNLVAAMTFGDKGEST